MLYLGIDGLAQLASQGCRWAREEVAELYPAAVAGRQALLDQAILAYDEIGMPRHRALAESMREALPAA